MSFGDVLILFLVVGTGLFWWRQDAFRRRALALAKTACDRANVQLLDDSVGLRHLRLRRSAGKLKIERQFGFEFSPSGAARYAGFVVFHGDSVQAVELDLSRTLAD